MTDEIPSKSLHAKLLDAVGEAVIATDLKGKIQYWNRAAENIYQWTAEEVVGKNIQKVTPTRYAKLCR
ncbi:MAG: PAS domain-containing protein [Chloroflexi bacterium]|nr:PAS domain-containing protein [Chloroflexota bacterium]